MVRRKVGTLPRRRVDRAAGKKTDASIHGVVGRLELLGNLTTYGVQLQQKKRSWTPYLRSMSLSLHMSVYLLLSQGTSWNKDGDKTLNNNSHWMSVKMASVQRAGVQGKKTLS